MDPSVGDGNHWIPDDATEISNNLKCSICKEVFQNPRKLSGCGHTFCAACLTTWIGRPDAQPTCPIDRMPVGAGNELVAPDRIVLGMLDDIRGKCGFCGYHGVKSGHACPLFHCPFGDCTFMGSDEDEFTRHQGICKWAMKPELELESDRSTFRQRSSSLVSLCLAEDLLSY